MPSPADFKHATLRPFLAPWILNTPRCGVVPVPSIQLAARGAGAALVVGIAVPVQVAFDEELRLMHSEFIELVASLELAARSLRGPAEPPVSASTRRACCR